MGTWHFPFVPTPEFASCALAQGRLRVLPGVFLSASPRGGTSRSTWICLPLFFGILKVPQFFRTAVAGRCEAGQGLARRRPLYLELVCPGRGGAALGGARSRRPLRRSDACWASGPLVTRLWLLVPLNSRSWSGGLLAEPRSPNPPRS